MRKMINVERAVFKMIVEEIRFALMGILLQVDGRISGRGRAKSCCLRVTKY